jgi:hypothetical protein
MAESEKDTALAFVLTRTQRLPRLENVLQALRDNVGDGVVPQQVQWEGTNAVFSVADAMVTVAMMPAPYPWEDLEGPCATSFWWPDVTSVLRGHQFHVLCGVIGGSFTPLERRVILTHVVRAVARTTDAIGVYWAEGTVVHEVKQFIEDSAGVAIDQVNLTLWIDVRIEPNGDGTCRCFTTGLTPLGHMEIEVERTKRAPDDLWGFIGDTASYMVERNIHFKNNETVGSSAAERFKIHHAPSMFDRGTVLKILMP